MPKKNRVVVRSNFIAAKNAGHDAIADAIKKATDEMEAKAESRLDAANNSRGYNLPTDIEQSSSDTDGMIRYPHWWGKFFEYGTVYITPSSFMRPGHRAGRKRLLEELDDNFEGWIRRKAGIRGTTR